MVLKATVQKQSSKQSLSKVSVEAAVADVLQIGILKNFAILKHFPKIHRSVSRKMKINLLYF